MQQYQKNIKCLNPFCSEKNRKENIPGIYQIECTESSSVASALTNYFQSDAGAQRYENGFEGLHEFFSPHF